MAISRKLSEYENQEGVAGQYQYTNLEDLINNFIVAYVGQGKVISGCPRHEVAFWGQRAVQEFSYDMFPTDNNLEFELGPTRKLFIPSDCVRITKLTWIDQSGLERPITRNRQGNSAQAVIQDDNYEALLDSNGEQIIAENSESEGRFQDPQVRSELLALAQNYYYNYITDYNYSYYNESYYGRQWGASPDEINVNGSYILDRATGQIVFDYNFQVGQLITLRYISDGLANNGDLTNVYIPKLAEDAVYAYILYNLAKLRPSASGAAGLYKKESYAKMKTAKIRLMELNRDDLAQWFRAKSKWIKH